MTGVAWPFNETGTTGAPAVTARQLRQQHSSFVAMGTTARPLGGKSGIRPGTPSSVVTITGSGPYTWNAGGFGGVIDGEANVAAGPYTYSFETADTGTIAAAGAAARVDRLDVQISDSDEGDGSGTKSVAVIYTQGAATGGVAPAAPARSHRLALINVPTSGAPTIQWAPDWGGGPGEWTFNTVAERDAYVLLIGSANVPLNQVAVVGADPTALNNDEYVWSGTWVPKRQTRRLSTAPAAVIYGAIPPAGTPIFEYDGLLTINGSTNSNGDTNIIYPFTVPNGIIAAHLDRFDYTTLGFSSHIFAPTASQSQTQLNLRIVNASGGIPNASGFEYAATILYW